MENELKRLQFTFYRSYYDAIKVLPKKEQTAVMLALCAYALDKVEPNLTGTAGAIFTLIRPTLDSGWKKAIGGTRGTPQKDNEKIAERCGKDTAKSSKSIYNEFVTIAQKISPIYISMIMPSRWMTGGKGLDAFRDMMINDKRIQIMHDYMEASSLFNNVQIEGGICYFLWNSKYSKPCMYYSHSASEVNMVERYLNSNDSDVVVRDAGLLNILDKVLALKEQSFADYVLPRNPFGVFEYESYLVNQNKSYSFKLFGRFDNVRTTIFLNDDFVVNKNEEFARHWKVFVSKADGAAGQIGNPIPAKIIGKAVIGDKETICTETFLAIGPFSSKQQCQNVVKYAETKFFRIMVGIRKNKNMTRDTYKFVPIQDFTSNSDIDWSVSIPEIDAQLYEKYGLSEDEIAFIEKMIKPM